MPVVLAEGVGRKDEVIRERSDEHPARDTDADDHAGGDEQHADLEAHPELVPREAPTPRTADDVEAELGRQGRSGCLLGPCLARECVTLGVGVGGAREGEGD
ncbi:MAG: hypothetical protein ACK55I_18575, partial [bacterium]